MTSRAAAIVVFLVALCRPASPACSLEPWLHPDIAGRNSIFVDVALAPVPFPRPSFPVLPLELRVDYVLPVSFPVSFGLFMNTPHPNLKSFGLRLAYHFDLRDMKTDLYGVYVFDFGFVRNRRLERHNDSPAPVHFFDFRVGVRRAFGTWLCLAAETGFKFQSAILFVSIKIN